MSNKKPSVSRTRISARPALDVEFDYVSLLLDAANRHVKAVASEIYERECGVNVRELRLLRIIGREPGLTRARLVEHTYLEKTLVSKLVSQLVRRKLVAREAGADDAREIALELTGAGESIVLRADPIGRRLEASAHERLGEANYENLKNCLRQLARFDQQDIEAASGQP